MVEGFGGQKGAQEQAQGHQMCGMFWENYENRIKEISNLGNFVFSTSITLKRDIYEIQCCYC